MCKNKIKNVWKKQLRRRREEPARAAKCIKLNVRSMADEEEDLYGSSDGVAATSSVAPVPAAVAAAPEPAATAAASTSAGAAAAAATAAAEAEEEVEEESSYDDDDDLQIVLEAPQKPKEIVIRADGTIDTRKDVWRNPVVLSKPKTSRLTYVRPGQATEGDNDEDVWRRATGGADAGDGRIAPREKTADEKLADEERGNGVSAFDSVIADEDEVGAGTPWREDGQDVSDYFNYGLSERTWQTYAVKQLVLRRKRRMPAAAPPLAKRQAPVAVAAAFSGAALQRQPHGGMQGQQVMMMQRQRQHQMMMMGGRGRGGRGGGGRGGGWQGGRGRGGFGGRGRGRGRGGGRGGGGGNWGGRGGGRR
jgi:hypothetical protein